MGWRNTSVCICMSWGDLYLYTDRWELSTHQIKFSGRMQPLNLICISSFIEKCGIVRVLNTILVPSDV